MRRVKIRNPKHCLRQLLQMRPCRHVEAMLNDQNSNDQKRRRVSVWTLEYLSFEFVSSFGFRDSNLNEAAGRIESLSWRLEYWQMPMRLPGRLPRSSPGRLGPLWPLAAVSWWPSAAATLRGKCFVSWQTRRSHGKTCMWCRWTSVWPRQGTLTET